MKAFSKAPRRNAFEESGPEERVAAPPEKRRHKEQLGRWVGGRRQSGKALLPQTSIRKNSFLWLQADGNGLGSSYPYLRTPVMRCEERSRKKLVEGREVIAQRGSTLSRASCRPQQLDTQRLSDLLSFEQTAGNEDGLLNILCFSRDYAAGQLLGSPRPKPLAFDLGRKQQRSSLSPGERAWWSRLALRLRALRSSPSSLGGLRPVSKQLQFPCVSNQDKYLTSHLPGV